MRSSLVKIRFACALTTVIAVLASSPIAWADGDAGAGKRLAQQWCASCHQIEATAPATKDQTHHLWEPLVLRAGYELCLFDGLNRFYVHSRHQELKDDLAIPANVFDRYAPDWWWRQLTPDRQRELDPEGVLAD